MLTKYIPNRALPLGEITKIVSLSDEANVIIEKEGISRYCVQ